MNYFFIQCQIISEVLYTQKTLSEVINSINKNGDFYSCVSKCVKNEEIDKVKFLTDQENDGLLNYIKTVGKGDKNSQIAFLNSEKSIIDEKKLKAEQEKCKFRSLYIKLGFMLGLILFIAFI